MSGFEAKKAMNYEFDSHSYGGGEKRRRRKKKMKGDKLVVVAKNVKGKRGKSGGFLVKFWVASLLSLNFIDGFRTKFKFTYA